MAQAIREWRGVEKLVYAKVIEDTEEAYSTGVVKPLAGVATIERTTEASTESHYYDNRAAININSTGSDEVTLTVSTIPIEILADVTGQYYDETTGMMVEGEREQGYFAIGYIASKDNNDPVYVWRLKGTFSVPDSSHNTRDDGTDANGDEIVFTGIHTTHVFAKNGASAKAVVVDVAQGKSDVSKFFDTVTTPDTLKSISA